MRKLKRYRVFLEGLADGVPDEPIVKLDSVGSAFGTETGNLWPLLGDGSVSWEDEIHWNDCDYSFISELSPEDRAKVDAAMVSTEDLFTDRVDMTVIDYIKQVLVAEELTDDYVVSIHASVWDKDYFELIPYCMDLPTVFCRIIREGVDSDRWIKHFKRFVNQADSNFSKFGIGYSVGFYTGGSFRRGDLRVPDDVVSMVVERVNAEFPGVTFVVDPVVSREEIVFED